MAELYNHFKVGEIEKAREIHLTLLPLMFALFTESNPIPVKAAMAFLGLCSDEIRTPLAQLADEHRPQLEKALADCNITGNN